MMEYVLRVEIGDVGCSSEIRATLRFSVPEFGRRGSFSEHKGTGEDSRWQEVIY
jgi:hypothetical protein